MTKPDQRCGENTCKSTISSSGSAEPIRATEPVIFKINILREISGQKVLILKLNLGANLVFLEEEEKFFKYLDCQNLLVFFGFRFFFRVLGKF